MKTTYTAGDDVVAHCGKCKLDLNHIVHAAVDGQPARVECRTCNAVHKYRAPAGEKPVRARASRAAAGTTRARGAAATTGRKRSGPDPAAVYAELMADRDVTATRPYRLSETYEDGELVEHNSFGVGLVTGQKGANKVEVTFETGPRILVHGK